VVSRPDKRRGRRSEPEPSPVKAAALELGLPTSDTVDDVLDVGADLGVVVAFGRIIKPNVLGALPLVNVHFSLLPRWRGAAPVERAILAGDTETGVCLMTVEEGLDTGAVYRRQVVPIGRDEYFDALEARLVEAGTGLVVRALEEGLGDPIPQEGVATYADKIEPHDLELHWDRPADELHRVIRLGRAWTSFRDRRLKIPRAAIGADPSPGDLAPGELDGRWVGTATTPIELLEVQPEGRRRQDVDDWIHGARPEPGEHLGGR
jgi:methionyl-tRNA formyltransferase